jgi:hypothetical protein
MLFNMLKKLQLFWIGLTLFLIFFIAGFNFETFTNGSHGEYASEIVCSGPSRELNCTLKQQVDVQLFRGSIDEPIQLQNIGVKFVSSSFANFLNLFMGSTDTLRTVILKVFAIKSLVAAFLVTYTLFLVKKFDFVQQLATKLFLILFSFPYLIFGTAGVYPAPIATVAVIPILITLKVFEREKKLRPQTLIILFINFFLSLSVIMANRFETTAFMILGICIFGIYNYSKRPKKRILQMIFASTVCLALFAFANPILRNFFLNSPTGKVKVLYQYQAESSTIVKSIGNIGLSVMAPITFVDNSTRNLVDAVINDQSNQLIEILLVLLAWIPLSFLLFQVTKKLLLPLFQKNSLWRKSVAERIPALLILSLFWIIPFFARTIWFFWYLAPLLAIFVFFTDHLENAKNSFKLIIWVAIAANAFYFLLVVLKLGNLELGGVTFNPQLQILFGYSLGLIAYKLVKNLLSTPRRSLIPD